MKAKERLLELVEALPEERAAEWCAHLERDERPERSLSRPKDVAALLAILQPARGTEPTDADVAEFDAMLRDLDSNRPHRPLFA